MASEVFMHSLLHIQKYLQALSVYSRFPVKLCQRGITAGSARHLYVVCIYRAICLQIQKYFPPDPAIFSPEMKY
jgi:hypothetical protein